MVLEKPWVSFSTGVQLRIQCPSAITHPYLQPTSVTSRQAGGLASQEMLASARCILRIKGCDRSMAFQLHLYGSQPWKIVHHSHDHDWTVSSALFQLFN